MNNPESFSIVVIPDTQIVTEKHPEILRRMTQRILEQVQPFNIKLVLHLGDLVNKGAKDEQQFKHAKEAFEPIRNSGLPLLISIGNHDYDNMLTIDRNASMFNQYFSLTEMQGKSWFGGALEEGAAENVYAKLDIDGIKLLVFALEFGPRDSVMDWVSEVMDAHPDHQAILITHTYMYMFGNRTQPGDKHNPKDYKGADGANDGEELWMKWLKSKKTMHSIYSGHHIYENISYSLDQGEHGNLVFQSFQNWQGTEQGGEGRYRIVTYSRDTPEMTVQVYNPLRDCFETEASFSVRFPMEADAASVRLAPWAGWEAERHPLKTV